MKETVATYFPGLSSRQYNQFERIEELYTTWNARINVISRKDIDNLFIHHTLFSLSIARIISFIPGTRIMDAGTGGGFPGIPLAILFPEVDFTLVDSIAKKIKVVEEVASELGLTNVYPVRERVENIREEFDFITGRAVIALPELQRMTRNRISSFQKNDLKNGILYLKGGDFNEEIRLLEGHNRIYELSEIFPDPFFTTKKLIHIYK
jgi:16S rRNA (guanine527-N7)-methyltransferase